MRVCELEYEIPPPLSVVRIQNANALSKSSSKLREGCLFVDVGRRGASGQYCRGEIGSSGLRGRCALRVALLIAVISSFVNRALFMSSPAAPLAPVLDPAFFPKRVLFSCFLFWSQPPNWLPSFSLFPAGAEEMTSLTAVVDAGCCRFRCHGCATTSDFPFGTTAARGPFLHKISLSRFRPRPTYFALACI